jgi:uncharacterized protein YndB with AHSA1/START domain
MSQSFKFLLSLIVIALTIAAALWIMGGKRLSYSTSLLIDAPPSAVFEYLTDAELMKQWKGGLIEVELIDGSPAQIGAKSRIVMESGGKQITFDDEVIRFEKDAYFSVNAKNRMVTITSIYRLEPKQDGKTSFTYVVKKVHHGLGKFIAPFVGDPDEEKITGDIQRLKDLVESRTGQAKLPSAQSTPSKQTETLTSGSSTGSQNR